MRLLTRALTLFAGLLAFAAFASLKQWLPRELLGSILLMLVAVMMAATWSGIRARHQALAERDRASSNAVFLAIAAQLGRQDDATLERIQARGGPAGEAAAMILTERRRRAARPGG